MLHNEIIKMVEDHKGKLDTETKIWSMSKKNFESLKETLSNSDELNISHSKKDENVFAIVKNKKRIVVINVTQKETVKKEKTIGQHGHKSKGNNYIVLYKNKDDKKETKIVDMTTCAEIKTFLKTVSKKQLEYLKIYDSNNNEVRKSAWVV